MSREREREPYVGLSDVTDVDPNDWQTSPGGQTHQVRGEYQMRRCSEPAYTITGTQYPTVIDGDFEPDPELSGVGDVECSRTFTREEVRAVQTISEIEVESPRKGEALTVIGNAVPADLAASVASMLPDGE